MNVSVEAACHPAAPMPSARPLVPPWSRFVLSGVSGVALAISAYLTYVAFKQGTVAGCAADGFWDCGHVLTSKWSKWLGLPVSLAAASLYTGLLTGLFFLRASLPLRVQYAAWSVVTTLALAAGAAAAWFIGLQLFVLGHVCVYCMVAHGCGLVAAGLVLGVSPLNSFTTLKLASLSTTAAGVLMVGQYLTPAPPTYVIYDPGAEGNTEFDEPLELDLDFTPLDELTLETESHQETRAEPAEADEVIGTSYSAPNAGTEEEPSSNAGRNMTQSPPAGHAVAERPTVKVDFGTLSAGSGVPLWPAPSPSFTPVPDAAAHTAAEAKAAETASPSPSQATEVRFPRLNSSLRVHQWPCIGNLEAPHVAIMLFDYTCPHCRQMSRHMEAAHAQFGNQLAVIYMPVPLHPRCNDTVTQLNRQHGEACELARTAVAVWYADAVSFPAFHRWLFQSASPPTAASAQSYAQTLVGEQRYRRAVSSEAVEKFIKLHVQLYKRAGRGTLPKLITSAGPTIEGTMSSPQDVCQRLQAIFGLSRP